MCMCVCACVHVHVHHVHVHVHVHVHHVHVHVHVHVHGEARRGQARVGVHAGMLAAAAFQKRSGSPASRGRVAVSSSA